MKRYAIFSRIRVKIRVCVQKTFQSLKSSHKSLDLARNVCSENSCTLLPHRESILLSHNTHQKKVSKRAHVVALLGIYIECLSQATSSSLG